MNGDVVAAERGAAAELLLAAALAAFVGAVLVIRRRLARGGPLVPGRPQLAVPWSGRDVLAVITAYLVVGAVAAAVVPGSAPLADRIAASGLVTLLVAVGSGLWLVRRGATPADLGFVMGHGRQDVGIAVVALGLVVLPLLALAGLLNLIVPYEHYVVDLLAARRDPWTVFVVAMSAVVVAPLAEEFFFRRLLQGWLEKRLGGGGMQPVLLSSLAFAAAHVGQGLAFVPLFPLAVVLGVIARQTGSIVPCVLLHGLFNAVSVALLLGRGAGAG